MSLHSHQEQGEAFKTPTPYEVEDRLARGGGACGNQTCRWANMFGLAQHVFSLM